MQHRRSAGRVILLSWLALALGAACRYGASTGPDVGPPAAAVAVTVPLDLAPSGGLGSFPNSDLVLAADGSPTSHAAALASLNASSESGTIELGDRPEEVASPPPGGADGPLLVISEDDNS